MAKYTIPELYAKLSNDGFVVNSRQLEEFLLHGKQGEELTLIRPRDNHILRIHNRSIDMGTGGFVS